MNPKSQIAVMQINTFILTQYRPVRFIDLESFAAHDHSAWHDWFRVSINYVSRKTVILIEPIFDPRCRKKVFQKEYIRLCEAICVNFDAKTNLSEVDV